MVISMILMILMRIFEDLLGQKCLFGSTLTNETNSIQSCLQPQTTIPGKENSVNVSKSSNMLAEDAIEGEPKTRDA